MKQLLINLTNESGHTLCDSCNIGVGRGLCRKQALNQASKLPAVLIHRQISEITRHVSNRNQAMCPKYFRRQIKSTQEKG